MNEFVFPEIKAGLYIVSLPIGCLSDISFRALHMLSNSDYVAGEDTRNVKSLFKLLKTVVAALRNFCQTVTDGSGCGADSVSLAKHCFLSKPKRSQRHLST